MKIIAIVWHWKHVLKVIILKGKTIHQKINKELIK